MDGNGVWGVGQRMPRSASSRVGLSAGLADPERKLSVAGGEMWLHDIGRSDAG
jgi:hypothetical protein